MTEKTHTRAPRGKVDAIISSIKGEEEHKTRGMEYILNTKLDSLASENQKTKNGEIALIQKEAAREHVLLENRLMAEAELTSRRTLAGAKERLVQQTLAEAKRGLRREVKEGTTAYVAFMKKRGEEGKRFLPSGSGAEMIEGDKTAGLLSSMGFKVSHTLPSSAIGGVLFHAPDGKRHIDSTLAHLMERDGVDIRTLVSQELFGEGNGKRERGNEQRSEKGGRAETEIGARNREGGGGAEKTRE